MAPNREVLLLRQAKPHWLCRLWRHNWHVWCINRDGHQSYRERRCRRCLDHGVVVIERQALTYFGGPPKGASWEPQRIYEVDRA